MKTCEVCNVLSSHLDSGVCPSCMNEAINALIVDADQWRESIARDWICGYASGQLYHDANSLITSLIDVQAHYQKLMKQDQNDLALVKANYKRAYRRARMESPYSIDSFVRYHPEIPENVARAAYLSFCLKIRPDDILERREYWVYRGELPTFQYYRSVKIRAIAERRTPPTFKPFSY